MYTKLKMKKSEFVKNSDGDSVSLMSDEQVSGQSYLVCSHPCPEKAPGLCMTSTAPLHAWWGLSAGQMSLPPLLSNTHTFMHTNNGRM